MRPTCPRRLPAVLVQRRDCGRPPHPHPARPWRRWGGLASPSSGPRAPTPPLVCRALLPRPPPRAPAAVLWGPHGGSRWALAPAAVPGWGAGPYSVLPHTRSAGRTLVWGPRAPLGVRSGASIAPAFRADWSPPSSSPRLDDPTSRTSASSERDMATARAQRPRLALGMPSGAPGIADLHLVRGGAPQYTGLIDAARKVVSSEGAGGLFRGLGGANGGACAVSGHQLGHLRSAEERPAPHHGLTRGPTLVCPAGRPSVSPHLGDGIDALQHGW